VPVRQPAATTFLAFDPYRRGRALAGTADGAPFASADGGASWALLAPFPAPAPCPVCFGNLAAAGGSGPAAPNPLGPSGGWFSFFAPENLEVAAKVLDGSVVDGHLWVFYTALTDVAFELTVLDGATGAVRSYLHPASPAASVADTAALPALPAAATRRRPDPSASLWWIWSLAWQPETAKLALPAEFLR
jgi:hypothetical protein